MATFTPLAPARSRRLTRDPDVARAREVGQRTGQWWLLAAGAGCCFLAGATMRPPTWIPATVLCGALLLALSLLLARAATMPRHAVRALVVGQDDEAAQEAQRLGPQSGNRLQAVAWCGPDGLDEAMRRHRPDAVVVLPGPALGGRALRRLTWRLEAAGIPLFVGSRLDDLTPFRARVMRVGSVGLVQVRPAGQARLQRALKRSWETAAAMAGLVAIAPVLLLIAVAIKLDSPGPVIFRQQRVGRDGRPFTMLKFRTMTVDAEERRHHLANDCDGVLFKSRQDPRVTRVGRVLRRFSFDELPQLVNVVRAQMSLVGPRPALFAELDHYDGDSRRRLAVTPGMTGLWQVSGRSDLPWEEAVRLDLDYVDNWSLGLDLRILARTAHAVVGHRGAY